jgi:serine O-acetyltransferase
MDLGAKLGVMFRIIPLTPHLLAMLGSRNRSTFYGDVRRWAKIRDERDLASDGEVLRYILATLPFVEEFRSVFYYRFPRANIFRFLASGSPALYLNVGSIGPGLYIQHGFATVLAAKSVGRDLWLNQQVTVGWNRRAGPPTIGDNVRISAGAKVCGDIHIGDNVIIGANAVVTKSVPANCVVAGIPARIIRRDGVKVDEPL